MSFDVLTIQSNDKSILSTTLIFEVSKSKLSDTKTVGDCWIGIDQTFRLEKFLNQIVNSCYWFLSVTSHFLFSIKHYELVSMLNVRIQRFQQILSF